MKMYSGSLKKIGLVRFMALLKAQKLITQTFTRQLPLKIWWMT